MMADATHNIFNFFALPLRGTESSILKRNFFLSDQIALEVVDAVDAGSWNELIRGLNGHFVQSHAWSRCMARMSGTDCRYLTIRKQGTPAAAGWYAVSSARLGRLTVNRSVEMESLPCYDPSRMTGDEVLGSVLSLARGHKAGEIVFGNSPGSFRPVLPAEGTVEKISFSLDLQQPLEVLLANAGDGVRRKLRKADKHGISVSCITRGEDPALELVQPLFEHTIAKHISRGKRRGNDNDFIGTAVRELVGCGDATLFMAFQGGDPLSCYLLSTFDRHALYLFGGSAPLGYRLNASYHLMWAAVTWLKERGFLTFSLGEVRAAARDERDADHGLYRFKKEFGGAETELYSGRIITRPLQHRCLSLARRVRQALSPR